MFGTEVRKLQPDVSSWVGWGGAGYGRKNSDLPPEPIAVSEGR